MNRSELLAFLSAINARPKKSLSQNFLVDRNIVHKILRLAEVAPGDAVIEIGPGPGALTGALLEAGAFVLAIEKDSRFAAALARFQTPDQRLQIVEADALDFAYRDLPRRHWKLIANLPYQITTPLLEKMCHAGSLFSSWTVMVQKEVADRMRAHPRTKSFGALTLFLEFYARYIDSFPVSARCFYPEPKVASTVIRFDPHPPPYEDPATLFLWIRKAFQQRRKMLTSSLKTIAPTLGSLLTELGLSPQARPEELSLHDWIRLVKRMTNLKASTPLK